MYIDVSVFVPQGAVGERGDAGVPGKLGAKGLQGQTVSTVINIRIYTQQQ